MKEKIEKRLKDLIFSEIQETFKVVNFETESLGIRIVEKKGNNEFFEMTDDYIKEIQSRILKKLDTTEKFNFYSTCKSFYGNELNFLIERIIREGLNSVYVLM